MINKNKVAEKLKYALNCGATIKKACVYAGIARCSYYRLCDADSDLKRDLSAIRGEALEMFNNQNQYPVHDEQFF